MRSQYLLMKVFILTGFILTISEATAQVKQVVVWNGETVTKGSETNNQNLFHESF